MFKVLGRRVQDWLQRLWFTALSGGVWGKGSSRGFCSTGSMLLRAL